MIDNCDSSIGEYEESYGASADDLDPAATDRAEEVMAAFTGFEFQRDLAQRRIRPGDWVVRAIGGKGTATLRFGRAYPAEKLTKVRQAIKDRDGKAAPHIVIYEVGSGRRLGGGDARAIRKAICSEGKNMVIVDKAIVPVEIRTMLDKDLAIIETEIKVQKKVYDTWLKEAQHALRPIVVSTAYPTCGRP